MSDNAGNKQYPYPGVSTITDGSGAVVWVETHISQAACAYPITSSTVMGGGYCTAVANGQENLWGEKLLFLELESEYSSASTCEGFALAGGRVTSSSANPTKRRCVRYSKHAGSVSKIWEKEAKHGSSFTT